MKSLIVLGIALALVMVSRAGAAQGEKGKSTVVVSVDNAKFKEVIRGVSKAILWGNDQKGPYSAFTKFAPGFDGGMHTHTNDIWLVVIRGAYLYKDGAGEKRVGPGGYISIPAKTKHWSGGDRKQGAVFYEESYGKFDMIPAK